MATKLEQLEKLLREATPGDWQTPTRPCEYFGETMIVLSDTYEGYKADCELICALRNSAPLLLEIVKKTDSLINRTFELTERALLMQEIRELIKKFEEGEV